MSVSASKCDLPLDLLSYRRDTCLQTVQDVKAANHCLLGNLLSLCSTASCDECYIGASTTLLTFPFELKETITVSVVPYITELANGRNSTSFSSTTLTTDAIGGNASISAQFFTQPHDLTWVVDGVVL